MTKSRLILIAILMALAPITLYLLYFGSFSISKNFEDWIDFASFLSGIYGPLAAIAAAILIYYTLMEQRQVTLFGLQSFYTTQYAEQVDLIIQSFDFNDISSLEKSVRQFLDPIEFFNKENPPNSIPKNLITRTHNLFQRIANLSSDILKSELINNDQKRFLMSKISLSFIEERNKFDEIMYFLGTDVIPNHDSYFKKNESDMRKHDFYHFRDLYYKTYENRYKFHDNIYKFQESISSL